MASLDVESSSGGNLLPAGWHRVVTGTPELKRVGANRTALLEWPMHEAEGNRSITGRFWATPKAAKILGSFADALGVTRDKRAGMDSEHVESLSPMFNRTLWVLVSYEPNNKGQYFREVTHWEPDGPNAPTHPQPKLPPERPAPGQRVEPAGVGAGADDDIPF